MPLIHIPRLEDEEVKKDNISVHSEDTGHVKISKGKILFVSISVAVLLCGLLLSFIVLTCQK